MTYLLKPIFEVMSYYVSAERFADLFRPMDKQEARREPGLSYGKILLFAGRAEPIRVIETPLQATVLLRNMNGLHLLIVGGDLDGKLASGNRVTFRTPVVASRAGGLVTTVRDGETGAPGKRAFAGGFCRSAGAK